MFFPEGAVRVHVYGRPVDMRKSFDGLCGIIRTQLQADPLSGALFVFVIGTDPELFLLLEAVRNTGSSAAAWQYSLARMSSQKMTLRRDGVDRWFLPNIYREPDGRNPSARYGETSLGRFIPSTAVSPRP